MSECKVNDSLDRKAKQQDETERQIKVIESRCRREVYRVLERAGVDRNSRNWSEYSRAKRLVFGGLWIDCSVYQRQISWICDYLSL